MPLLPAAHLAAHLRTPTCTLKRSHGRCTGLCRGLEDMLKPILHVCCIVTVVTALRRSLCACRNSKAQFLSHRHSMAQHEFPKAAACAKHQTMSAA